MERIKLRGPQDIPDDDIATDDEVDEVITNIFN